MTIDLSGTLTLLYASLPAPPPPSDLDRSRLSDVQIFTIAVALLIAIVVLSLATRSIARNLFSRPAVGGEANLPSAAIERRTTRTETASYVAAPLTSALDLERSEFSEEGTDLTARAVAMVAAPIATRETVKPILEDDVEIAAATVASTSDAIASAAESITQPEFDLAVLLAGEVDSAKQPGKQEEPEIQKGGGRGLVWSTAPDSLSGDKIIAVMATVRELLAFANNGQIARGFSLYTEQFYRQFRADSGIAEDEFDAAFAETSPVPAKDRTEVGKVTEVKELGPDRLSARVSYSGGSAPPPDERFTFVYSAGANRWLIDDIEPVD